MTTHVNVTIIVNVIMNVDVSMNVNVTMNRNANAKVTMNLSVNMDVTMSVTMKCDYECKCQYEWDLASERAKSTLKGAFPTAGQSLYVRSLLLSDTPDYDRAFSSLYVFVVSFVMVSKSSASDVMN